MTIGELRKVLAETKVPDDVQVSCLLTHKPTQHHTWLDIKQYDVGEVHGKWEFYLEVELPKWEPKED